ncbi:MAG: hypothetical protein JEZ10_04100 [Verrucomicrobia bacterium]|nr:hypothetical protein [Verrucomicrobiota bacterium]
MKRWKNIPALLALIALLLPCPHAAGHAHEEDTPETACVAAHPVCHTCTESVCSDKLSILTANSISPVELPDRNLSVLYTLPVTERAVPPVRLLSGNLVSLRTVQLLI